MSPGLWTQPGSQLGGVRGRPGYLGNWHLYPEPEQARGPVRVPTPRPKEGRLASSGWEGQKDPLNFGGLGAGGLFMKSWGPVNGGSCWEASPAVTEVNTIPKSKGSFTLAGWLVLRMEKTVPSFVASPRS